MALLIGHQLDKGFGLLEAIDNATVQLTGAYSFVLISILEPENMYVFKNTGTMVIGISDSLKAIQGEALGSNQSPDSSSATTTIPDSSASASETNEEEKKDPASHDF